MTQDFSFQTEVAESVYGFNAALFFDMGLGKTKIIIDETMMIKKKGGKCRAIIICPNTLVQNWIDEYIKFVPGMLRINDNKALKPNKERTTIEMSVSAEEREIHLPPAVPLVINIVPYSRAVCLQITNQKWDLAVLDECHLCKNPQAQRSQYCMVLKEKSSKRIAMTGTPVPNTPADLYNLLQWVSSKHISRGKFLFHYVRIEKGYGNHPRYTGWTDNLSKLKEKMREDKILFLDKTDVLKLPPKHYVKVLMPMDELQEKYYNSMNERMGVVMSAGKAVFAETGATKLIRLSQITGGFVCSDDQRWQIPGKGVKIHGLKELMTQRNGKFLIFARFTHEIKFIAEELSEYNPLIIYGGVSMKERRKRAWLFNNDDKYRVLVGGASTAGLGLTLLGTENCPCKTVFYYSNGFSYSHRVQSEDRCYRIGQQHPVTYYDLICEYTIDEQILELLQKKRVNAEEIKTEPAFLRKTGSEGERGSMKEHT